MSISPVATRRAAGRRIATIAAGIALGLGAFLLGRLSVLAPVVVTVQTREEVTIRRGPVAPWIEVHQNGELVSEWHETKDAELWRWLDMLLREDPELYVSQTPRQPPPGRGPHLQHARRP